MTQKQELDNARTRITELEGQLSEANEKIVAFDAERTELNEKFSALETKHKSVIEANAGELLILANANTGLRGDKNELERKNAALSERAEKAEGEATKLKAEAKDAETRAREIAARAGVVLGPKALGAGNAETDKTEHGKPTGTWRERAKSAWKIQE